MKSKGKQMGKSKKLPWVVGIVIASPWAVFAILMGIFSALMIIGGALIGQLEVEWKS